MTDHFGDLEIAVRFHADTGIVSVRGEIDALTAPTLTATLTGLVDAHHPGLLVDLDGCTFMDAAGVRTIAAVARQVSMGDGSFTLRKASANIVRILEITGVSELGPPRIERRRSVGERATSR